MNNMDFVKQYLIQSISYATGNLRLTSNQIELLALIKELILKSENLEDELIRMKKVTEFSTLGIKLHDIYTYLTRYPIDIAVISDKFRQHSRQLDKDINHILYNAGRSDFKALFDKIKHDEKYVEVIASEDKIADEKTILDEFKKEENPSFTNFEEIILQPIKSVDSFLNELSLNEYSREKMDEYIQTMKTNSELSKKNGFEILGGLHQIVSDSLDMIKEGSLKIEKETIESLRACLIVIAAVIRGKEVNISDYLNKADRFSEKINSIKQGNKR